MLRDKWVEEASFDSPVFFCCGDLLDMGFFSPFRSIPRNNKVDPQQTQKAFDRLCPLSQVGVALELQRLVWIFRRPPLRRKLHQSIPHGGDLVCSPGFEQGSECGLQGNPACAIEKWLTTWARWNSND
jgi:hypothetical protein